MGLLEDREKWLNCAKQLEAENADLRSQLETERMRLSACGVVAMSDTPESAARNRNMKPEYMSASCQDVIRRVDECIDLRSRLAAANAALAKYEEVK